MRQPHSFIRRIVSRGQVVAVSLLVLLSSALLFARTRHLSEARGAGQEHANPAGQRGLGLSSLSSAAQPVVSATLGRDDARYQVRAAGGTLSAENPAQALRADFTRRGMQVRAGGASWSLALAGYGYGDQLQSVPEAAPQSSGNRVEYRRGPLVEWYVNGPLGVEQGFTLNERPKPAHLQTTKDGKRATDVSPLTIALALGGDLSASADSPVKTPNGAGAQGLTLSGHSGQAVLRYTGLTAYDASGRELAAWLELGREGLRLRVKDAGARYPVSVDPLVQQAKLTASDGGAHDQLGTSVGISSDGSTIVVGAAVASIGSNFAQGAAYVFVKPSGGWATATQIAKLTASDGTGQDEFGSSVGVSGDGGTIVVGEVNDKIGSNPAQGAVYVFVKPSGGWATTSSFTAKLTASDGVALDFLGTSVGINSDGSTIVAGATANEFGAVDNSLPGAAYVFVRPSGGWATGTETAKLTASDGATGDELGTSVGISSDGSTIMAGADQATVGTTNFVQGAAYVFLMPSGGWATETETAKLTASDGGTEDKLGITAAISGDGNTIVAGAAGNNSNQGAAYVFVKPSGGWATETETAKLTASDGTAKAFLGLSVGMRGDGSTIVAGAPPAKIGSNSEQGAAYVFVKPSGGWATESEAAKLTASDGAAFDSLGSSVNISSDGSTIVASAPSATIGSNLGQGAAYVFLGAPLASRSNLSFGSQQLGTTSSAQSLTLTNNTNAALNVAGVTTTSGFAITHNCVGTPIAVGAGCTESVTFGPTSTGAQTGNATFSDDSGGTDGSTQSLSLSGTGSQDTTSTTVISSMTSPVYGQFVTFTATVTNTSGSTAAPTGSVQFVVDGADLGSPVALTGATPTSSSATETTANLTVAGSPHSVVANYVNADGNFMNGSGTLSGGQTVSKDNTMTTITSNTPNSSMVNQAVSVSVSVTANAPGSGTPTQTVTVSDGVGQTCMITLSAGAGSCSLTPTAAGADTLTATYNGDGNFNTSPSAGVGQTVVAPPSISKAFSPNSIVVNNASTLTFTLTNPAADTVAEQGVAFTDALPAGLVVSTPNGLTNNCGGSPSATAGGTSISLTGVSIQTNSSCTLVVNVTGTASGVLTNTSGAVSSTNGGTGNKAIASLTVLTPQTATQNIITLVNTLHSAGVLNSGQDTSLDKQLQQAITLMNEKKISAAIQNLQSFIGEVNDLQRSGVLTQAQANPLITQAKNVIKAL